MTLGAFDDSAAPRAVARGGGKPKTKRGITSELSKRRHVKGNISEDEVLTAN
jgi:hypothetical protein